MNTGLFRFFRFECWAWRMLYNATYDKVERLYIAQHGPLHLYEERPAHGVAIAEVHFVLGPIAFLLGRSVLG